MKKPLLGWLIVLTLLGFVAGSGTAAAAAPGTDGTVTREPPAAPAVADAPKGTAPGLASVDDLKDKRIGALQGSAHVEYVEKTWPRATLLQYNSPSDLVLAVKTGKVDAALSDAEPLREMLREDRTLGVLGESLFSFPEGVGFRKDNTALLQQFNRFLAQLKQSGIHADMVDRWMEKNITDMPVIANAGTGGELVVGISDGGLPFVAIKDGKLIGFEIELAERFAAHLGKKVRFSQIDFSGLIAAVATGKVDMIIAAIFITEERKQSISFSDPYYEEATKVFGLKKNIAAYDTPPAATPELPFSTRIAASFHSNIIHEKRYLLLWDGLKATVLISIFATILGTLLGALVCYMRMAKLARLERAGAGVHRHPARHAAPRPADAHLLRRLRLGEHRPARGRHHRVRAEFRGLRGGDLPHRRRGDTPRPDRGRHRDGLQPGAAPSCTSCCRRPSSASCRSTGESSSRSSR